MNKLVFDKIDKFNKTVLSRLQKSLGRQFLLKGLNLQGAYANDDVLVPSLRRQQANGFTPSLDQANFIAPNATILGQVGLKEKSSIWYGSIIRGDLSEVQIGSKAVIQDLVTIKQNKNKNSTIIGDNVLVGPNCILDGCTIENNAFIGMGSTLHSGSKIEANAVVAAGSVVFPNTIVPSNQIWAGNPAQYLRDLTPEESIIIREHHEEMVQLASIHSEECEKSFREVISDRDRALFEIHEDVEEKGLRLVQQIGLNSGPDEDDVLEQSKRIYMKEETQPFESELKKRNDDLFFEQDLTYFPQNFKQYEEDFTKIEKVKKYFEENKSEIAKPVSVDQKTLVDQSPWTRKF